MKYVRSQTPSLLKNPPEIVRKIGSRTKTNIKIPENNRLIKSTGSLKIKENSWKRRLMPGKDTLGNLDAVTVGFILLRKTNSGRQYCRPEHWVERLFFQILSGCNLVGEFVDELFLVFTCPLEVVVNQVDLKQFGVREFYALDRGGLISRIDRS